MLKKYAATFTLLFLLALLFVYPRPTLDPKHPLQLLFNQCDDDLRTLFYKEIQKAKKNISLSIYALNDEKILSALIAAHQRGVEVRILTDSKNPCNCQELEKCIEYAKKTSKLMHQKILILDEKRVWMGSANFTSSSLRTHDNGLVGILDRQVAQALLNKKGGTFIVGGQKISVFFLPQEQKEALTTIIQLLANAKYSIAVAMYTWTHPELTQLLLHKKKDGVQVEVAIDSASYQGTSKKSMLLLKEGGISLLRSQYSPMFHHKMAYIDKKTLILGSTNWTKAAFTKNDEQVVIIHDLTEKQRKKMDSLWHILKATGSPP